MRTGGTARLPRPGPNLPVARDELAAKDRGMSGRGILVGTCSWTDSTLVKETDWYPKKSMSAAERLAILRLPVPDRRGGQHLLLPAVAAS